MSGSVPFESRGCSPVDCSESGLISGGRAVFAQWGSTSPVSRGDPSSRLLWLLIAGVLLSFLLGAAGSRFVWDGAGGLAEVTGSAESRYLAEVARTQADAEQVTVDMLAMEATLPEVDPGRTVRIAQGAGLLRDHYSAWKQRSAPSAVMETAHGSMVEALGRMATAVGRAQSGLEIRDVASAWAAADAYEPAEADFSSACAALLGEGQ